MTEGTISKEETMRIWSIEKTEHGYLVICYSPATEGMMGRNIYDEARFDTMREARAYAKRRGAKVIW